MEQVKRNKILLIAFIFGILGLIIWIVLLSAPVGSTKSIPPKIIRLYSIIGVLLAYIIVAYISLIVAVILNLLAWLRNDTKKILVVAILYIFSLTIISMIMCFTVFIKTKRIELYKDEKVETNSVPVTYVPMNFLQIYLVFWYNLLYNKRYRRIIWFVLTN